MITQPSATRILCFGDSNTWGQKPETKSRYGTHERWTGVLQNALSTDFAIIEEGLNGRTTNIDYAQKPGLNGKTYLVPCLCSQNPLDGVVLMLGTNDCKIEFDRSAADIAEAVRGLVDDVQAFGRDEQGNAPKILLISPVPINPKADGYSEAHAHHLNDKSVQVSFELGAAIATVAEAAGCDFLDAGTLAETGADGTHLTKDAHEKLGLAVAEKVKEWA